MKECDVDIHATSVIEWLAKWKRTPTLLYDHTGLSTGAWCCNRCIDNQAHPWPGPSPYTENYVYDASGNLLIDQQEGLIIKWNPYGKIEEVRKNLPSISQTTKFWYNAAGNVVKNQVINNLHLDDSLSQITYYVRDANEQVLAIYDQLSHDTLGTSNCTQQVGATGDGDGDGVPNSGCDLCTGAFDPWQNDYDRDGTPDMCDPCPFKSGTTCAGDTSWVAYQPPSNPWNVVSTKLAELMVYGDADYGRILVMKPDTLRDTTALVTDTYTRRIGKKEYQLKDYLGNVRVVISDIKLNWSTIASPIFRAKILAENSYYAFGMLQPGQVYQSVGHRYGYNGKEMDNEIMGSANSVVGTGESYDFGERMYDPRLAKWMSVDPFCQSYPGMSPYNSMADCPIFVTDPSGGNINFKGNHETNEQADYNEKLFLEALTYLEVHDTEASKKLRQLYEDPNVSVILNVHYSNGNSHNPDDFEEYSDVGNTINWDPEGGYRYTDVNGQTQITSPAIGLAHEGTHAWNHNYDPLYNERKNTPDQQFGNQEERNATETEGRDAIKAGEVTAPRPDHSSGEWVRTISPISNKTLQDVGKEVNPKNEQHRPKGKKGKK